MKGLNSIYLNSEDIEMRGKETLAFVVVSKIFDFKGNLELQHRSKIKNETFNENCASMMSETQSNLFHNKMYESY